MGKIINETDSIIENLNSFDVRNNNNSLKISLRSFSDAMKSLSAAVFNYQTKKTNKQSQVFVDETITSITSEKSISTIDVESESQFIKEDILDFIDNVNPGNFLPLNCGHNGLFNQTESENYRYLLRNAKFIE